MQGAGFYGLMDAFDDSPAGAGPGAAPVHWLFARTAPAGTHAPHTLTPAALTALTAPAGKTAQAA